MMKMMITNLPWSSSHRVLASADQYGSTAWTHLYGLPQCRCVVRNDHRYVLDDFVDNVPASSGLAKDAEWGAGGLESLPKGSCDTLRIDGPLACHRILVQTPEDVYILPCRRDPAGHRAVQSGGYGH